MLLHVFIHMCLQAWFKKKRTSHRKNLVHCMQPTTDESSPKASPASPNTGHLLHRRRRASARQRCIMECAYLWNHVPSVTFIKKLQQKHGLSKKDVEVWAGCLFITLQACYLLYRRACTTIYECYVVNVIWFALLIYIYTYTHRSHIDRKSFLHDYWPF